MCLCKRMLSIFYWQMPIVSSVDVKMSARGRQLVGSFTIYWQTLANRIKTWAKFSTINSGTMYVMPWQQNSKLKFENWEQKTIRFSPYSFCSARTIFDKIWYENLFGPLFPVFVAQQSSTIVCPSKVIESFVRFNLEVCREDKEVHYKFENIFTNISLGLLTRQVSKRIVVYAPNGTKLNNMQIKIKM